MQLIFASLLFVSSTLAAYKQDLVTSLPEMNDGKPFDFKMYSGYLQAQQQRNLHYIYVESQKDPANDPIILWFNGGPGCSSMLGFLQEHGPFVMEDGETTFHKNDYSWNKEANVLYLESPVGVGYSYSYYADDHDYTDLGSSVDNLYALLQFYYFKFPELSKNELWLAGESYAGIYVPYLAWQIDEYNALVPEGGFKIPLKGFIVGNGVTNWKYDGVPAYIDIGFWHGLYDLDLYDRYVNYQCSKQYEYFEFNYMNINEDCWNVYTDFTALTQKINVYDVYGICYNTTENPQHQYDYYSTSKTGFVKIGNELKTYNKFYTADDYTPWMSTKNIKRDGMDKRVRDLPPCTFGFPIIKYLNNATVRTNLHIPETVANWDLCNMDINNKYQRNKTASQWIYETLQGKYKVLFYSGDTDGAIPTLGSVQWINELNWNIKKDWRNFFYDQQVAGYFEEREGLTFATIHGAGHMAPQLKRAQTYYVVFNFIQGKPYDDGS